MVLSFRNKFNKLIKNNEKNSYSIKEIIKYFEKDSVFAILFIFTFPTSIPSPAYAFGSSTMIGGFITCFLSIQLFLGYNKIYMPEFILKKRIKITSSFRKRYYKRFDWVLSNIEWFFNKNRPYFFNFVFLKISALLMFLNSILMMLPLILTNWLPSTAVTLMSFSYLFKDGFMFFISLLFAAFVIIFYLYAFNFIISYIIKNNDRFIKLLKKYKNMIY